MTENTENTDEQTTADVAEPEPVTAEEEATQASQTAPVTQEPATAEQPAPAVDEASTPASPEDLENEDALAEEEVDTQTYTAQI